MYWKSKICTCQINEPCIRNVNGRKRKRRKSFHCGSVLISKVNILINFPNPLKSAYLLKITFLMYMYAVLMFLPDYYLISFQRKMVSAELARAGNSYKESLRNHYSLSETFHYLKHFLSVHISLNFFMKQTH